VILAIAGRASIVFLAVHFGFTNGRPRLAVGETHASRIAGSKIKAAKSPSARKFVKFFTN